MNHYLDDLIISSKHILLLQGPTGSFFAEFSKWLKTQNKTVFKINLNAGDEYFYPKELGNVFAYQDTLEQFPTYLKDFCQKNKIDNIICFGDSRKYHQIAKNISTQLNIAFWAFEEGYFRPHYVTFEKGGVNAFSILPKNAEFFLEQSQQLEINQPQALAKGFAPMSKCASKYYIAANLGKKNYPYYQNHKPFNLGYYAKLWTISGIKRAYYALQDIRFAKRVEKGEFGDFFIVPLQVYDDSQVQVHSDYPSVASFLQEVLQSFANHAPDNHNLIVKHHPMDRGFIDYGEIIEKFVKNQPHLAGRIFYIHDVPMPVFLRYGKGMVTLNSTSGISALLHGMPVKTLGRANYDFAGLTDQGSLDQFWVNPKSPDPLIFDAYRKFHLNKTQLNGNFYNRVILSSFNQN